MATLITIPQAGQEPFRIRARVAMARLELSVTELAKIAGCNRVTASEAINHGLHDPTRRRLAEILGIEP